MNRHWYDRTLAALGLALMGVGLPFFVLVYSVGAPVIPFAGLVVASLGLWFLSGQRMVRQRQDLREKDGGLG